MLRITTSSSSDGAKAYFRDGLRRADYYVHGEETKALWQGKAAARLGLEVGGEVDQSSFERLLDGLHPETGGKLTARLRANRRAGADFTFSVPKSVSLVHALNGDERIVAAFHRAVGTAMGRVEADMATRVRRQGADEDRITGNMIWAGFLHKTARPVHGKPDPHLHMHCYVPNITFDEIEGRWKAAQLGNIKADGAFYEAVFLNEMAHELRGLGYNIRRSGRAKWWEIDGIEPGLVSRFSRRTSAVEARAEELGLTTGRQKDGLGATTRERKAKAMTAEGLGAFWRDRLMPADHLALERIKEKAESSSGGSWPVAAAEPVVEFARAKLFATRSVVTERELVAEALNASLGTASAEAIEAAHDKQSLIKARKDDRTFVTTLDLVAEEARIIDFAKAGRGTRGKLNADHEIADRRLNAGQRAAVTHILASRDRVMLLRGGAGTGKTTLLQEAARGIAAGGGTIRMVAPTAAARDVLRGDGFAEAETLQLLIKNGGLDGLGKGSVVWVDEAGLVSVPQMVALTNLADRNDWRLVLAGDTRQHGPVERGDAMRVLEKDAGLPIAEVTEILRQKGAYKEAVKAIERGDLKQGWERLDAMGAVIEVGREEKAERLAADYLGETRAGRSTLIVAPTHKEKNAVTEKIRLARMQSGEIDAVRAQRLLVLRDARLSEAEKGQAESYRGGEIIEVKQNAEGLKRGQRLTVAAHDAQGRVIGCTHDGSRHALPLDEAKRLKVYEAETVLMGPGDLVRITENGSDLDGHKLTNGAIHRLEGFDRNGDLRLSGGLRLSRDHGHLDLGYATTSHSSQGRTVDTVLVSMGPESERAISKEQLYVTVSRGRERVRIYTDDKAAVAKATERSSARTSATELVGQYWAQFERAERQAEYEARSGAQRAKSGLADRYYEGRVAEMEAKDLPAAGQERALSETSQGRDER